MSTHAPANKQPSMRWLHDWRNAIATMKVAKTDDVSQYDRRDFLMAQHLKRSANLKPFDKILANPDVMAALAKPYQKLLLRESEDIVRGTLKQFIADACWICSPTVNSQLTAGQVPRSTQVDDLKRLSNSCFKLADKIRKLMPAGALSLEYLTTRMDSGNQPGFSKNRPHGWATAMPSKETGLPLLLQCFASDVLEQAGMIQNAIDATRQTGGKLSAQHFAINSLCTASTLLSTAKEPAPLFNLVSRVIGVLMCIPPPPVDTLRKRYTIRKKKKSQP